MLKYKKEMNKKVRKYASEGLSNIQIARNLGIAPDTFYQYLKRFKEFKKEYEKGKQELISEVESSLYKRAMGYDIEEEKIFVSKTTDGKEIVKKEKTKKHLPPDVGAIAFYLKNKARRFWSDRQNITHEGEITKIVINPSNKKSKIQEESEGNTDGNND